MRKPPYKSMRPATALTYATAPWRLLVIVAFAIWVPLYEARNFLKWQAVGVALHLCAIAFMWLWHRSIDLSLLNPWTYSDWGWLLTAAWYWFWLWMWVIE